MEAATAKRPRIDVDQEKIRALSARFKRWSKAAIVDEAIDTLMKREGLSIVSAKNTKRKQAAVA